MWKKVKQFIKRIFAWLICIYFVGGFLWYLNLIVPKTRTHFKSHQAYIDYIGRGGCFGTRYFMDEMPIGTEAVKYYWHYTFPARKATYSMILAKDTYKGIVDDRISFYVEESDSPAHSLLYEFQGDECHYIDDSKWYRDNLDYVNKVLYKPEAQQQYYFLVIIKINVAKGICYKGVIKNDTTHELIEFSAEMPEDYPKMKPSSQNSPSWLGLVELIVLAAIVLMVIRGMTILDRKIDERAGRKKE